MNEPTSRPLQHRDAERSRARILDAAERLIAERGPGAVSLADVGQSAGVSRATPSYFFASKEGLHRAVLERVFADREQATVRALAPVRTWAATPSGPLASAIRKAVADYLEFLLRRPAFVRLVTWEGLDGGGQLRRTPRASRAMHDAFSALSGRTTRTFDVDDVVLVFVSLTFTPLLQRDTLMATLTRDLGDPQVRERHVSLVTGQLMAMLDCA